MLVQKGVRDGREPESEEKRAATQELKTSSRLCLLASSIARAKEILLLTLLVAWLLFPVLVGIRDTFDAGYVSMSIALGIVMVVGLTRNRPSSLLP